MGKIARIGLAQINCTVGDLNGNCRKILDYVEKARDQEVDLVLFPELTITGYPPEDLLLKPKFIQDNIAVLKEIAKSVTETVAVIGFVDRKRGGVYNSGGDQRGRYQGHLL